MGFVGASEPIVQVAWAAGALSLAASVVVVVAVLRIRHRLAADARRREAVFARWRPILFEAIAGGTPALPKLAPSDADAFLLVWVQLLDGLRGEPVARLAAVGAAVGARELAKARIQGRDALGRVLALRTFGHLRRVEDRDEVLRWLDDPRSYVALAAARALVRIDPELGADELLPRLASRTDWPVPLFASVLAGADRTRLSARFFLLSEQLAPSAMIRLLPLAPSVDDRVVDRILGQLLSAEDPELLAGALRHVRSATLLEAVRRAAAHPRWSVRVQAAAALGRVGEPRDRDVLMRLLQDPEWWVRYRAAQALATRPFGTGGEIAALAARSGDRFAMDIVRQVLAEGRE